MMNEQLVERYKKLYCGVVFDAMTFDLKVRYSFMIAKAVKPCWDFKDVLFGPAFTCKGERVLDPEHIDDTVRIKMFQKFYSRKSECFPEARLPACCNKSAHYLRLLL